MFRNSLSSLMEIFKYVRNGLEIFVRNLPVAWISKLNCLHFQALALNGQKLLGAPLVIQPTLAERNRAANNTVGGTLGFGPTNTTGPLKLYVGQLHTSITEDMLGRIFDPFGKVYFESVIFLHIYCCNALPKMYCRSRIWKLQPISVAFLKDMLMSRYIYKFYWEQKLKYLYNLMIIINMQAFQFRHADDGKRAMEQMNGFELAGRPMKVWFDLIPLHLFSHDIILKFVLLLKLMKVL